MNFRTSIARALALTTLSLGALSAQAAHLVASNTTYGTVDAGTISRDFVIGSSGTIVDLNLLVDFGKCPDVVMAPGALVCPPRGPFDSNAALPHEIFMVLTSPTGTRVDLVWTDSNSLDGIAAGSTKIFGTYSDHLWEGGRVAVSFDDEAASALGPAPASGQFRAEELLSAFDGADAMGTWTLSFGDSVGQDPLTFFNATLSITTEGGTIPEPGSLALVGATLLGAAGVRRRHKCKAGAPAPGA